MTTYDKSIIIACGVNIILITVMIKFYLYKILLNRGELAAIAIHGLKTAALHISTMVVLGSAMLL